MHASGAAGGVQPTQPIGLDFQIPNAINEVRGPHGQGVVPRLAARQQALHASVPRPTQNARWGSAHPLKIFGEPCWKRLDGVVIYVAAQAHIGHPHGSSRFQAVACVHVHQGFRKPGQNSQGVVRRIPAAPFRGQRMSGSQNRREAYKLRSSFMSFMQPGRAPRRFLETSLQPRMQRVTPRRHALAKIAWQ